MLFRSLLCNALAATAPTACFILLELLYGWPNAGKDYWGLLAGSPMEAGLMMLGGSFGSLVALLVLPGLIIAIARPKIFLVTSTSVSFTRAFFLTLSLFGLPIAVYYARAAMSLWQW